MIRMMIMTSKFSWAAFPRPIIALSPMADMTDSPFCRIVKEIGAAVVFREMVSSEAIFRENEKTWGMAAFDDVERPIIQQIFGNDPEVMAEAAAKIMEKFSPDGIDINMGCPVYKMVSNFNGACLMKDPPLAAKIVRAVCSAVNVPVSVKIRLGWSRPDECLEFVKILEDAGAALITIHGRTRTQNYSGVSDWEMIGRARAQVKIPVLANGDINTPEKVWAALAATGAAGVLIARGALGNPWIFKQARELLTHGRVLTQPDIFAKRRVILRHAELHVAHYGPGGIVSFRKHLSWYFKGLAKARDLRNQAVRVTSLAEVGKVLEAAQKLST
ncbi:MAG: tRNA-dihydrouridine synthase [Candidatus Magasanikbacteria bacterium]|nr:tRNA-dihydrouridine synthase [Candidatus Magasanikbacteria bacterium]